MHESSVICHSIDSIETEVWQREWSLADSGLRGAVAVGGDEVSEGPFVEVSLGEATLPGDDDHGEGVFETGGEDGVDGEVGGDGLEGVEFGVGELVGVVGDPDDAVFEGVDGVAIGDRGGVDTGVERAGVVVPPGRGESGVGAECADLDVGGGWVGDGLTEQGIRGADGLDSRACDQQCDEYEREGDAADGGEAAG